MMVEIHSRRLYKEILKIATNAKLIENYGLEIDTIMNTKYKNVTKKVTPVITQLPLDFNDHIKKAENELGL